MLIFIPGDTFVDEKTGLKIRLKRGSLCAVDVDISRSKVQPDTLRELHFSCEEVEALYSIGFQKVNDHCKGKSYIFWLGRVILTISLVKMSL